MEMCKFSKTLQKPNRHNQNYKGNDNIIKRN